MHNDCIFDSFISLLLERKRLLYFKKRLILYSPPFPWYVACQLSYFSVYSLSFYLSIIFSTDTIPTVTARLSLITFVFS